MLIGEAVSGTAVSFKILLASPAQFNLAMMGKARGYLALRKKDELPIVMSTGISCK